MLGIILYSLFLVSFHLFSRVNPYNISENTIFILTFSPYSRFGPYLFILPLLIPK